METEIFLLALIIILGTIVLPIFVGIMIGKAFASEADDYIDEIINMTKKALANNQTIPDEFFKLDDKNYTDNQGNNFNGNNLNLQNNTKEIGDGKWPICWLFDMPKMYDEYRCQSV